MRFILACRTAALALLLVPALVEAAIPASERNALIALYNSTNGANWTNRTNWLGAAGTECTWFGVSCTADSSAVVQLLLNFNNLTGTIPAQMGDFPSLLTLRLNRNSLNSAIPPELSRLTRLQRLYLYTNSLSGSIPDSLGQLSSLLELNLSGNQLSGTIPATLGSLANVQQINLGQNPITGSIPVELTRLPRLTGLYLDGNRLSGNIPPEIGNLTSLQELSLFGNQLSGEIPRQLELLVNLRRLVLGGNQLSGAIPPELGKLTRLEYLVLHTNRLSGAIPPELGAFPSLQELSLQSNLLTGSIPPQLGNLANLRFFYLYTNQLTGPIPPELGQLTRLEKLHIYNNQLTGGVPASFGGLTSLQELQLFNNRLTGPIPPQLGNLSNLALLVLAANQLSGPIPSEFGRLSKLQILHLYMNQLSGTIPPELGTLTALQELGLYLNQLTGEIPRELGNLTNLRFLIIGSNQLSGTIPPELGRLTKLEKLHLNANQLTGLVPAELAGLKNLQELSFYANQLSGTIPSWLGELSNLRLLVLGANRFTGGIPRELGGLANLVEINLYANQLTGPIPRELGNLSNLLRVSMFSNQLSGEIPAELGRLTKLQLLSLGGNTLNGPVPAQLGNLVNLQILSLDANQLSGSLPRQLTQLTALQVGGLNLKFNALYTNDGELREFLNRKQRDGNWEQFQTVAPTDLAVTSTGSTAVVLSWRTIRYTGDGGGYQIGVSTSAGGPGTIHTTTADKKISSALLKGLMPSTTYFFAVRSVTYPFGFITTANRSYQQGNVASEFTTRISATTTQAVQTPAEVVVYSFPAGMFQEPGRGGATDRYVLTNIGQAATSITLSQTGSFFTQSPASFNLNPGATQVVNINALAQPDGAYEGASIPAGVGVRPELSIPIRLLSVNLATGTVVAEAVTSRIDVFGPAQQNPAGFAEFRNDGNATLIGMLVSDVDWVVPQGGLITIPPGQTIRVDFRINRARRPDAASLAGALTASLFLIYPRNAQGLQAFFSRPLQDNPNVGKSVVSVVDTVRPTVNPSAVPPLAPGEVALIVPGIGRITGSVGLFLSDLTITNGFGTEALRDVRVYYAPLGGAASSLAQLPAVTPGGAISFGDVVKSVFDRDGQLGTLQIRSASLDKISVNATIFNVSKPAGTHGTGIPVFRTDRSAGVGERQLLTGLRSDATTHTNLFLQETSGLPANIQVQYFDRSGAILGSASESLGGFGLVQRSATVPMGAVSAAVTTLPGSAGRVVAYATPVDDVSGDFWSVVDWGRHFGGDRTAPVIIPVAGTLRGRNNTFFRTDLAVMNAGTTPDQGVLRYHRNTSEVLERTLSLGAVQTTTFEDVVGSQFGITDSIGYLTFTPSCPAADPDSQTIPPCTAFFAVTSRTFATVEGLLGTFGTGVPAVSLPSSLRLGQSRLIAGIEDISSTRPATFRTNLGLAEVAGSAVTVRVTLFRTEASSLVAVTSTTSKDISLQPNEFWLRNLGAELLGANPTDLRNAQVLFEVTGGDGAVMVFTSSLDNGTGDTILKTE